MLSYIALHLTKLLLAYSFFWHQTALQNACLENLPCESMIIKWMNILWLFALMEWAIKLSTKFQLKLSRNIYIFECNSNIKGYFCWTILLKMYLLCNFIRKRVASWHVKSEVVNRNSLYQPHDFHFYSIDIELKEEGKKLHRISIIFKPNYFTNLQKYVLEQL